MARIPSLTFRKVERILWKNGYELDHVTGSHYVYFHPATKRRVTLPRHTKELPRGTLLAILKQAGVDWDV